MNTLSRDELKTLIEKQGGPCISIFMPTHRTGRQVLQDPIRFKNLLRKAEEQLREQGVRSTEANALLKSTYLLLEDNEFWRHQSNSLAVFISNGDVRYYRLPVDTQEMAVVVDRFHVKPLLPLLSGDGLYYILALSMNKIRLLKGSHYSVKEMRLRGIPGSLAEALRVEGQPQKMVQFHTRTPTRSTGARRDAMMFGSGPEDPRTKEAILRFFQQVDDGVYEVLKDEHTPLVLAGVKYLFPIYREANTYPYLIDDGIAGNPDDLSPDELNHHAWALVQPMFQQAQREALDQYGHMAGLGSRLVSTDIHDIVTAAYEGRVDFLFVALGMQKWGTVDPVTRQIEMCEDRKAGCQDLLDYAAIHTLSNSGTVFAVPIDQVPEQRPMAAMFRY